MNTGLKFYNVSYLYLLFLLPIAFILFEFVLYKNKIILNKLIHSKNISFLISGFSSTRKRAKFYLLLLSSIFLFISFARPQWGLKETLSKTESLDIIVLLDMSASMNAEDIGVSRLQKAKHEIATLTKNLSGDRIGIIGFAASAEVLVPMTSDYDYINDYLQNIETNLFSSQGTAIDESFRKTYEIFERLSNDEKLDKEEKKTLEEGRTRAVLVLSDGEDHTESKYPSLQKLKSKNISVSTIVIGTETGGPIPIYDENGKNTGYKKDSTNNSVITKANPAALKNIANIGQGSFYVASIEENEIQDFVNTLANKTRSGTKEKSFKILHDRYQIFLAFSLFFFFVSIMINSKTKSKILSLIFLIVSSSSFAVGPNYVEKNNKGIENYKNKKYDDALKNFAESQAEQPDSDILHFNLGTSHFKSNKNKESIAEFNKAIESTKNPKLKAEALFNSANAFAKDNDKKNAIQQYLKSYSELKNINDKKYVEEMSSKIKKNIELLSKEQKNEQKQNQDNKDNKKDNKEKNKDQNKNEKQENKDNKDEKKDKQDEKKKNEQDKKNEQNSSNENKENKKQDFKSEKLNKEDAENILNKLSEHEKEINKQQLQKKINKGKPSYVEKDW